MDIKNAVKQWLTEKENKRYAKRLQEKRVTYGEWIRELEGSREWPESEMQETEYIVFLASEGVFLHDAATNITRYFKEHPHAQIIYGDEEVCEADGVEVGEKCETVSEECDKTCVAEGYRAGDSEGNKLERKLPWFKPDWSPDVFRQCFYFGSAVAVRGSMIEEMAAKGMPIHSFAEKKEYSSIWKKTFGEQRQIPLYRVTDAVAYRKWMSACVEMVGGFMKGNKAIGHIPEIWYSCYSEEERKQFWESKPVETNTSEEKLKQVGALNDEAAQCEDGAVSVIIPSKDNPEILKKCIHACIEMTKVSEKDNVSTETQRKASYEIIVVDNGSSEKNREKIEAFISELQDSESVGERRKMQVTYLYTPMEFNFSRMCNLGAANANGRYLLFLNDDVELCQPGTIEKMVALAGQEYTGAVGLKLLYPGTDKIQHAGITNLPMGPVHKMQFLKDSKCYYYGANRGNRNVLAVTAACLMVEKAKFEEVGGFAEELPVAFNDVDFCFSLYELGYHNVCVNDKYAYHHESLSRGGDESVDKLNRLLAERDRLYARHPKLQGVDPYYSVHLNHDGLDTRIRPGYITSRNQIQQVAVPLPKINLTRYRQDACLMVRVEDFREQHAVGYGVVLGDNNACYEKTLVFERVCNQNVNFAESVEISEQIKSDGCVTIYSLPVIGQYRPDLEENMPDQVNVALSGYDVKLGEGTLSNGTYRIGMAARNRVTGLKLVNWTNRYIVL